MNLLRRLGRVHYELVYALIQGNHFIEKLAALSFFIETLQYLSYLFHVSLPWNAPEIQKNLSYLLLPWHSEPVVWFILALIAVLVMSIVVIMYEIVAKGGIKSFRALKMARYLTGFFSTIGYFPVLEKLWTPLRLYFLGEYEYQSGTTTPVSLGLVVVILIMLPLFYTCNIFIYVLWFDPNPLILERFRQSTARVQSLNMLLKTIVSAIFTMYPMRVLSSFILLAALTSNLVVNFIYPCYAHPWTNIIAVGLASALFWGAGMTFLVDVSQWITGWSASETIRWITFIAYPLAFVVGLLALHQRHANLLQWRLSWKEEFFLSDQALERSKRFSQGQKHEKDVVIPPPSKEDRALFESLSSDLDGILKNCRFASDVDYIVRFLVFRDLDLFGPLILSLLGRAIDKRFPKSPFLLSRLLLYVSFLTCIERPFARKQSRRLNRRIRTLPYRHDIHFVLFYTHRHWEYEMSALETGEDEKLDALGFLNYVNNLNHAMEAQNRALEASLRFWTAVANSTKSKSLLANYAMIRQKHEDTAAWYYQLLYDRFPNSVVILRSYASLIDTVVVNKKYASSIIQLADNMEERITHAAERNSRANDLLENIGREETRMNPTLQITLSREMKSLHEGTAQSIPVELEKEEMQRDSLKGSFSEQKLASATGQDSPNISSRSSETTEAKGDDETDLHCDMYKAAVATRRNKQALVNIRRLGISIYASLTILYFGVMIVYLIGNYLFVSLGNNEANILGTQRAAMYVREMEQLFLQNPVNIAQLQTKQSDILALGHSLESSLMDTLNSKAFDSEAIQNGWHDKSQVPLRVYQPVRQWSTTTDSIYQTMRSIITSMYDLGTGNFTSLQNLQNSTSFRFLVDNAVRQEWLDAESRLVDIYSEYTDLSTAQRQRDMIIMVSLANLIPLAIMLVLFLPNYRRIRIETQLASKLLVKIPQSAAHIQILMFRETVRARDELRDKILEGQQVDPNSPISKVAVQRLDARRSSTSAQKQDDSAAAALEVDFADNSSVGASSDGTSDTADSDTSNEFGTVSKSKASIRDKNFGMWFILTSFLSSMAVLSLFSLIIMSVLLIENQAKREDAYQLTYANNRRVWASRMVTLSCELIRYDQDTWPDTTRNDIRQLIRETLDLFVLSHEAVTRGNTTLGLSNVDHDPTAEVQIHLLYDSPCNDDTKMECWNMDTLVNYMVRLGEMIQIVPDNELSFDLPVYVNMRTALYNYLSPLMNASFTDFDQNGTVWISIAFNTSNIVFTVASILYVAMILSLRWPITRLELFVYSIRNILFTLPKDRIIQLPLVRDYLYRGRLYTKEELWNTAKKQRQEEKADENEDGEMSESPEMPEKYGETDESATRDQPQKNESNKSNECKAWPLSNVSKSVRWRQISKASVPIVNAKPVVSTSPTSDAPGTPKTPRDSIRHFIAQSFSLSSNGRSGSRNGSQQVHSSPSRDVMQSSVRPCCSCYERVR